MNFLHAFSTKLQKITPTKIGVTVITLAYMLGVSVNSLAIPKLKVEGNKVTVGGKNISLGGASLFWSNNGWGGEKYYTASTVSWIKNDWHASIVRAAMGVDESGGYFDDRAGNEAKVRRVVEAAIANDMYVIIDWHTHHAHEHNWSEAINFFTRMARDYGNNDHVIYEIYNEPLQVSWSGAIKPYAEAVINAIRAVDPDNLIIVGTPTWSQGVKEASQDPIIGNNIAYTLHFYSGTHTQWLRDDAYSAMQNGIALFATEWGSVDASGDGAVAHAENARWMSFLKQHHISHANWSVNDKAEGASALRPGASPNGGWSAQQLTESGTLLRNELRSWSSLPDDDDHSTPTIKIEAEDFLVMNGVQLESTSDSGGGQNVGWLDAGDWLSYREVNIPSTGTYEISYRVASPYDHGRALIEKAGGNPVYGTLDIPNTGGWQNWVTVKHQIELEAGLQRFGLAISAGGWNLNWFEIKGVTQ